MHTRTPEFSLIAKYFKRDQEKRRDVTCGIGDDTAVLLPAEDSALAVTTDTMVQGVHFDEHLSAHALGHKLLAVNLSDLAAMGAEPAWLSLALTMPSVDETWLADFSQGFFKLADYYHSSLVGGDVTRGPLTLTLTAQGQIPKGKALYRDGAKPGDRVYVSGTLGDAAAALAMQQGRIARSEAYETLAHALFYPEPRVALGQALRVIASSAIDISDGLVSDLQHILFASGVGARIELNDLPASEALMSAVPEASTRLELQTGGGEDYELCFTVPESRRGSLETVIRQLGIPIHCIGVIESEPGLRTMRAGEPYSLSATGFSHFGADE